MRWLPILIILSFLAACGVKGPPLPPVPDTGPQSDLGPAKASPSPSPSAKSA